MKFIQIVADGWLFALDENGEIWFTEKPHNGLYNYGLQKWKKLEEYQNKNDQKD